jgi:hypothetical protein
MRQKESKTEFIGTFQYRRRPCASWGFPVRIKGINVSFPRVTLLENRGGIDGVAHDPSNNLISQDEIIFMHQTFPTVLVSRPVTDKSIFKIESKHSLRDHYATISDKLIRSGRTTRIACTTYITTKKKLIWLLSGPRCKTTTECKYFRRLGEKSRTRNILGLPADFDKFQWAYYILPLVWYRWDMKFKRIQCPVYFYNKTECLLFVVF